MTAPLVAPLEIGDVARELKVSADSLRRWERQGIIPPPRRTSSGRRVFFAEDLEEIRRRREARAATRVIGAPAPDAA